MRKKKTEYVSPFAPTEIPDGVYYGSLPDKIIIDGVHWICTATAIVDGVTYDKLINSIDRSIKKVERMKLLNFLKKNQLKCKS